MIRAPLSALAAILLAGCSTSLSSYFDFGDTAQLTAQADGGYQLGKAQLRAGNYGLAIDTFRTALNRRPKSIELLNGLAIAYAKIGRPEEATLYFGEALALKPNSVFTLANLNYFYLNQGDKPHALAYGKRAQDAKQRLADKGPLSLPMNVDAAIDRNLALAEGTADLPRIAKAAPVETQDLAPLTNVTGDVRGSTADPVHTASPPTHEKVATVEATSVTNVDAAIDRNLALAQGAADLPRVAKAAPVETQDLAPLTNVTGDARGSTDAPVHTASVPTHEKVAAVEATSVPVRAAPQPPPTRSAKRDAPNYRVSNGAGIRGLAGRTADYLAGHGVEVRVLSNEKSFDHRYSLIFYNPGLKSFAANLSAKLPMHPQLVEAKHGAGEVELILGADATAMAGLSASGGSGA